MYVSGKDLSQIIWKYSCLQPRVLHDLKHFNKYLDGYTGDFLAALDKI